MPAVTDDRPDPVWRPGRPVPLGAILGILRHGASDPAYQRDPDGSIWRACRTPLGPVTLRVEARAALGEVVGHGLGPGRAVGARRAAPAARRRGRPDRVRAAARAGAPGASAGSPAWRVPQSGPGVGVARGGRGRAAGDRAGGVPRAGGCCCCGTGSSRRDPVPSAACGCLRAPKQWAAIPSWEWLRAGVDPKRSADGGRGPRRGRPAGGDGRAARPGGRAGAARRTGRRGLDRGRGPAAGARRRRMR